MKKLGGIRRAVIDPGSHATIDDLRRAAAVTGIVGAIFAVLFVVSLILLRTAPKPHEADQVYVDFYASNDRQKIVLVGLYLLPLAAVAFIWFIAALRQWSAHSRRRGSQMIGTVQLVSGVAFITLALASAAASTMPAALAQLTDEPVDPALARDFPLFGNALLLVFGVRMAAMFVLTTTNMSRASGFMPRWFAVVSVLTAAVLFLSASLSVLLAVLFPLWVLAFGVLIIVQAYRMDPESPLLRPMETQTDRSNEGDDIVKA